MKGALQKTTRDPTGKSGRAPDAYHLSDDFTSQLDSYLKTKEMKIGYLIDTYIAPNWAGVWKTTFGQLEIVEEGIRYVGTYPGGTIEGKMSETEIDTLVGTWHEGAASGDFEFTMHYGGNSFWGDRYGGDHGRVRSWNGELAKLPGETK
ncbi:MAG: hypothetical protein A4E48_02352 [Methanosaeta sp. PtaU1.Bin060]|nr:MAG: hypothetical protein A4E44_02173 [Methanosaeta sp. PtaB.Bin018]OPY49219.1 MAG: hypothetical protein A4E48_02352 [Methanosaeta sp. PtaU1.Bin060]